VDLKPDGREFARWTYATKSGLPVSPPEVAYIGGGIEAQWSDWLPTTWLDAETEVKGTARRDFGLMFAGPEAGAGDTSAVELPVGSYRTKVRALTAGGEIIVRDTDLVVVG
jgi:hypothetical protein